MTKIKRNSHSARDRKNKTKKRVRALREKRAFEKKRFAKQRSETPIITGTSVSSDDVGRLLHWLSHVLPAVDATPEDVTEELMYVDDLFCTVSKNALKRKENSLKTVPA